ADPCPGPPRISLPPRENSLPGQCAETRQARPGAAARVKEPPPCGPPQRRQDQQEDIGTQPGNQPRSSEDERTEVKRQAKPSLSGPQGDQPGGQDTGSPGSRAWRFRTCHGSLAARGPLTTRAQRRQRCCLP